MKAIYLIILYTLNFIYFILYRVRYVGCENIPKNNGYIVASNHRGLSDPLFICYGARNKQVHFMAKVELFRNPVLRFIIKDVGGAIPVSRGSADMESIDALNNVLNNDGLVGIFIEGTRSHNIRPSKGKSGAALMARQTGCGIIPCAIIYDGKLKPFKRITVVFGKPIEHKELFPNGSASLRYATNTAVEKINLLIDEQGVPRIEDSNG